MHHSGKALITDVTDIGVPEALICSGAVSAYSTVCFCTMAQDALHLDQMNACLEQV